MAARGQTWRDSEVDALINVWSNETIQTQLRGSYRNEPIYRRIEEELRKRGIVRGWKQCRDKLKALKKTYKDILDKLRRSGAGVESEDEGLQIDWRYFWPMHRVMGSRPTATPRHLLGLGSRDSPVVSESGREVDYQQEDEDEIQQEENQQPLAEEENQQPLAVEQSQQLLRDSQQLPTAEEVPQQPPTEQNQQLEDTNQECQHTAEEDQPGPSRRKRRKITKSDRAQKDISTMMERLAKQQDEMKATLMQLEERRAEREAEQGRRELEREDRLLDLLSNIVMRNSGMMMPMPTSQVVMPPMPHVPPSSPPFNAYHGMYTFNSPGSGDGPTSGDDNDKDKQ